MAWSNLHCIWLYAILAFLTFTSLLSDLFSSSSLYHFAFSTFNNDLIELHLLMHIRPSEYLKSTIVKYARDKLVLLVNISLKDYLQQNIINRFVQLLK